MYNLKSKLVPFIILAMIAISGCSKSTLQSGSEYNVLSQLDYYLNSNSIYRVYNVEASRDRFVTELVPQSGALLAPPNLTKGDYGTRTDPSLAQPLNLVLRVYAKQNPSGDFYFESLVLGPTIELSNVTTALSWYLRFSVTPQPQISLNAFKKMMTSIELLCKECRKKSNTEIINLMTSNPEILSSIRKFVDLDNPGVALSYTPWQSPGPLYAYSAPNLTLDKAATKNAKETESASLEFLMVSPESSTTPIRPNAWIHTKPDASVEVLNESAPKIQFSYDDRGQHRYVPSIGDVATDFEFNFNVDNLNRNPYCDTPMTIRLYANRLSTAELSSLCRDPDADSSTISFSLSAGPVNLSISDIGRIQWVPPQAADGQDYTTSLKFIVSDSERGFYETEATILVTKDQIPQFVLTPSSPMTVEGTESTFSLSVEDAEGDPVKLTVSGVDIIQTGFPVGAGNLTNVTSTQTGNRTDFVIKFTPSYMQTISQDGQLRLKFVIKYDDSNGILNGAIVLNSLEIPFGVTNVDDPPIWQSTPPELTLSEAVNVGAIPLAFATDPNPNPSAISYTLESLGGIYCSHPDLGVQSNAGMAELIGQLSYASYDTCIFQIKATDSEGLNSLSEPFTINVTDVNNPVTVAAGAPTVFNDVFERKLYIFPVDQMFTDLDNDLDDPSELYTPSCHYFSDASYTVDLGTCGSLGVAMSLGREKLFLSINPSSISAGTYYAEVSFTDKGGTTATHRFTMIINQAAAPMDLETYVGGAPETRLNINENDVSTYVLRVLAASADPIDTYDFVVGSPSCSKIGGGMCPNTLMQALGPLSGTGTTDLNFRVSPDFAAGDVTYPDDEVTYLVSFNVQKSDDSSLRTDLTFQINVKNTNRAPTAIGVTAPSFGCTGDPSNSDTGKFQICIDLSKDKKSGSNWQKTYNVTTNVVDPDTVNDSYTYSLALETSPGAFNLNVWSFKIPGCFNPGSSTVYRTYDIKVDDGRGGTVTRPIELKIIRASAAANCM